MPPALLPLLGSRVAAAVHTAFGADVEVPDPLVLPSKDPRHGDYTIAAPMALARTLRRPPPELAATLASALDVGDICADPEVVAPGFVNLRLRPDWLAARIADTHGDPRLGVERSPEPELFAVDYSHPNVAKEMHVGHLRSTIIGSALCDVYEFLGHDAERINHIGDWGTQFGMLIAHLEDTQPAALSGADPDIGDIEGFYREANERFQHDEAFKDRARNRVVELQSGEPTARAAWEAMRRLSRRSMQEVYDLLEVEGLIERGESFYQPMLAGVVADLEALGLLVVDDGARCVFVPGFTNKEGDPLPLIVQKADGGYNYATTDLAALRHRIGERKADVLLYVVAADQSQHLEMVFAVARAAGWVPEGVMVEHVPFGLVQGEAGKRLR
ncbi:MAG: arginine--tRNA ligase, partial [Acidimicrobiales bacterium]